MRRRTRIIGSVVFGTPVLVFAAMTITGTTPLAFGMHDPVQTRDGIAVGGLDVVALTEEQPYSTGNPDYIAEWNGAIWRFSNAANRAAFKASPEQYAPQCGGYCAFAAAKGFAAESDAQSFALHNGKLYFFAESAVKDTAMKDVDALELACGNFQ